MSRTRSLKATLVQKIDSAGAWEAHISSALGPGYWLVGAQHMFQTRLLVFARMDVIPYIQNVWAHFEATGLGRVGLNKGGVAIMLRMGMTQLAFVGSHLAAHQGECARRNQDVAEIIKELCPPHVGRANLVSGPHHVVWMGDLNYRLDWGEQAASMAESPSAEDHADIVRRVQGQDYGSLLETDQLAREMREGRVFGGFAEAPIAFPPTFKVIKGTPGLAYGLKRSPAWCDRVLVRSNLPHKPAAFGAYFCAPDVATSDHKPVAAVLQLPLVTPRALVSERCKPFRLYLCAARLLGEGTWKALSQLMNERLLGPNGAMLRLMVSGPELAGGGKEQVGRAPG
ncbi:MAG: Endonuclease/exonuclease/phosphatase [Monoraphidium minutum]|nr:MAG: Endonuclease/exonuclease/phosphatase [Monoraphidium minutum]